MNIQVGWEPLLYTSGQQSFSLKGQRVKILGFVGHRVSAATTLPCCSVKVATDSM